MSISKFMVMVLSSGLVSDPGVVEGYWAVFMVYGVHKNPPSFCNKMFKREDTQADKNWVRRAIIFGFSDCSNSFFLHFEYFFEVFWAVQLYMGRPYRIWGCISE